MIKIFSLNVVLLTSVFESKGLSPNNCALLMVILKQLQWNSIFSFMSGIQHHRKVIELFQKKSMSELTFYNASVQIPPGSKWATWAIADGRYWKRPWYIFIMLGLSVILESLQGCGWISALLCLLLHTFIMMHPWRKFVTF